jgi:serine/threonine protein kinase
VLAGANTLILNKYKLGARLAVGGMGEVHLAQSPEGKTVVIKTLLPHLAHDQQMVAQFIDEAKLASKLKHPNLVHVHEFGQWKDTWVLAMEHIDGPDLGQVLKRCAKQGLAIPWQVAVAAISDAALGLHYAHELADARGTKLNLIHRDVSPQNILVGRDGRARVLDFGIAASVDKTTRTATGILKGKLAYMAPEQAKSETLTASVDQFALGLVLWELLTARRAFVGPNDVSLLKLAIEGVVAPPSTVNATIPAPVEAVVMRMLKPQVADRYSSLKDAQFALRALIPGDPQELLKTFVAKVPREDVVESMQTRSTPRPGAGATPPRGNETAELTPRTPKTPIKAGAATPPAANLPLLNAFLAKLPQGLESFPEVQQKGSILPSFLEGVPIQPHLAVLPGPLAEMIKRPPSPAAWISEVKVAAIFMACADLCFPSADAFVQFANRGNRKVMDGPIYSMLFRVLGVKRIVKQVSGRWEQFHRGTTLTLLNFEGTEGRLKLVAPPFSTPLLFAQCHGQAIHVGVEIAGGKNVSVTCTESTPGTFDYVCRWTE